MTFINGQPTGALSGGLVRNPRSLAAQKLWAKQCKPTFAPYESLVFSSWDDHGVLAGGEGDADEDRGVNRRRQQRGGLGDGASGS